MPRKNCTTNPSPGPVVDSTSAAAPQHSEAGQQHTRQTNLSSTVTANTTTNDLQTTSKQEGTGRRQTRQTTAKATSNVASEKPVTKTKAKAIPRPRAKAPITSAPALETVLLGTPEAAVHPATPNTEATPPPQTRQVLANDSTNSRGAKATNNRLPTSSQPAAKKRERGAPSAKADAKAKKAKANEQVEQLQDEMVQHWRAYEDNDEAAVARETAQAIRRLSDIAETSLIDFDVAQVLQNQAEYEAVDNNSSNEGSAASGKQGFVSKSFG